MKIDKNFNKAQQIQIDSSHEGQRLDNYLFSLLKNIPRSKIYKIIRKGEVRVNGSRKKPEYKLKINELIRIPPVFVEEKPTHVPNLQIQKQIKSSIILDTENFIALNKPSGFAVHGGTKLHWGIINTLRFIYKNYQFLELIHRLDKETSGCLLIAKSRKFLLQCQKAWQDGRVIKEYQCLVKGRWPADLKTISESLSKNQIEGQERMVQVDEQGKTSVTHFQPIEYYDKFTLLKVVLETGRTHQIRVHTAHAGHPIAGDEKYGDKDFNILMKQRGLNRLFLHACKLQLPPELYTEKVILAPLPSELQKYKV